jgi:large subunit ribosomal protein L25
MPKQVDLTVVPRRSVGRAAAKQTRRTGAVPAVLYGKNIQPLPLSVNQHELETLLHHARGSHMMINLIVDDGGQKAAHLALLQDIQIDPIEDHVVHVDFHEVSATEKIHIRVPVRTVGEPAGVKEGGILEYLMREIEIECLPKDLPEVLEADVTALKLGESIHLGELKLPAGVAVRGDKSLPVFTVAMPTTEEQLAAEAEAATGEVEVITAKKEEGEEGEAAPAEGKEAAAKPGAAPAAGAKGAAAPAAAGAKGGAAPAAGAKPGAPAAPAKGAAPASPAKPEGKGKK